MPENTPRYSLVIARHPSHQRLPEGGWCWSVFDARSGRVHRVDWVRDYVPTNRSRLSRDALIADRRERAVSVVRRFNAGTLHWHGVFWEKNLETREGLDA